jgi:hypothetical protein
MNAGFGHAISICVPNASSLPFHDDDASRGTCSSSTTHDRFAVTEICWIAFHLERLVHDYDRPWGLCASYNIPSIYRVMANRLYRLTRGAPCIFRIFDHQHRGLNTVWVLGNPWAFIHILTLIGLILPLNCRGLRIKSDCSCQEPIYMSNPIQSHLIWSCTFCMIHR